MNSALLCFYDFQDPRLAECKHKWITFPKLSVYSKTSFFAQNQLFLHSQMLKING